MQNFVPHEKICKEMKLMKANTPKKLMRDMKSIVIIKLRGQEVALEAMKMLRLTYLPNY